ncbi:MAG: hypothetical protein ACRECO_10375 [Xanthobacteraceae bacterium]
MTSLSSRTPLVLQHWRGELSLPVSFWLVGVLGNFIVSQASNGIERGLGGPWGVFIASGVFCVAGIYQSVGIWRSAGHSIERKKKYLWPVLARVVAIMWVGLAVYFALFHPGRVTHHNESIA